MNPSDEIQEFLNSSTQRILQMQQDKVKQCFDNSNNSIDDFTDCFRPFLQRMEAIEKPIQVSVLYTQLYHGKCMGEKNDMKYCNNSSLNVLKDRINNIMNNL